ncbi:MAG: NifB/NifX family molybdenum-iron cluster-binding protein [Aminobacterium sp.]|jgi:predicted Fe-Mo cluster-binding NifX family protein|uniref:NifB/NifX family molybdenum-iron cluster-binding protein n=1 Tax=unclassified Aminobacterium TaxID=2685012 RepID=UPI001BCEC8EF|nr:MULTISPECIES: NifB/NifX family molybdenum-iron cluster-binding protein [unclassified Aminobacterium]MDD2206281.1 NifB/NifX family molybdenum-iron cluster-binding protein [Aminobacterium sp.]MDD3425782.1 NifB/NifX family molybdenum-iron cluster-binding protein [Aminobacterium sp.]MDD3708154.1 NifB/NifX family molybdenum-iron cluster-binding protein [Aminobacterium sp.]MDD4228298.1 NifB/NifX family molybdenum-iron cluster-binding protein [Aminobacterium sp.]MDD4551769.1 NifB/NifX family molyb
MRIAAAVNEPNIKSLIAERFARAPYFVILNDNGQIIETIENSLSEQGHGAGGAAVRLLSKYNIDAVIVPRLGPNAEDALAQAGIKYFKAEGLTLEEALNNIKKTL